MLVFLKKVIRLSFGFVLINLIYLVLIATTDSDFKKRMESLNFDQPEHDILIFGNSLAMDGIDCEYLNSKGFDCYNMSIGGSSIKTSTFQLEEYISKYHRKPEFIVMGLGTYMFSFDDSRIHPVVAFTGGQIEFSFSELPIVKFKWLGIEFMKKIVSKHHRQAHLKYGQLRFAKTVKDNTSFKDSLSFQIQKYKDSKELKEFVNVCIRENIKLVLIEMPGFKITRNQDHIGPYSIAEHPNVVLFNLNNKDFTAFLNDDYDWIGNSHLNERGALKFTQEMFNVISQSLFFKSPNE